MDTKMISSYIRNAKYEQTDLDNISNASLIATLKYVIEHSEKIYDEDNCRHLISEFTGFRVLSRNEIEEIMSVREKKFNDIRNLFLFACCTGWNLDYIFNLKKADLMRANFLNFKNSMRRRAVDFIPELYYGSHPLFYNCEIDFKNKLVKLFTKIGLEETLSFESAKSTFLFNSVVRENAPYEQIQNAIYMPSNLVRV